MYSKHALLSYHSSMYWNIYWFVLHVTVHLHSEIGSIVQTEHNAYNVHIVRMAMQPQHSRERKKWATYWLFVLKTVRSNYFPTFQHFIEIQLENALPLGLSTFDSVGYAIRSISLNKCIRRVRAMNSIWHFERMRVCRRVYIIIRFVSYKLQSNESNRKCSANWLFWITVFKTPAAILCSFKLKSGLPKAWLIDYSTDFSPPNTTKFQQFYYFLPYNDCSANFHVLNNLHQKLSIWSRKRHTESGAWS